MEDLTDDLMVLDLRGITQEQWEQELRPQLVALSIKWHWLGNWQD